MTSRELSGLALKCGALWLLFHAVNLGVQVFALFSVAGRGFATSLALSFSAVFSCVCAFALWRFGSSIAKKIETSPSDEVPENLTAEDLEVVAFRLLGVYFAVTELPALFHGVADFLKARNECGFFPWLRFVEALYRACAVLFGLFLTAKPKSWVAFLRRLNSST